LAQVLLASLAYFYILEEGTMAAFALGKLIISLSNKRISSSAVGSGQTQDICGISLPKFDHQNVVQLGQSYT
jgi:hypothetical protein